MKCGLLGRKLGHSYSPQIHEHLGKYPYVLHEKEPEELGVFLRSGDFTGLNVTIPYKKDVLPYCSELSDWAKKLGAVNTIVRRSDGSLAGHNTDYFGFRYMLEDSGLQVSGKKVLVLGSGGASLTVVTVLKELGADVVVVSRSGENNYQNIHIHSDCAVIVNATPVGMYPHNGQSPVDLRHFPKLEGVLDLIYNPARTRLLLDAESRGCITRNGLWMLVAQAKESAEWFTGSKLDDALIPKIYQILQKSTENWILIGMPGCGKSAVGTRLAQLTGRPFVDADAALIEKAGMSIPDFFQKFGENAFRKLETDVLRELGKRSGFIIATGGGCITRQENYDPLHQNGRIIWLSRDLSKLPTEGRPLSQANRLSDIYQVRQPLYAAFADYAADNNGSVEDTCRYILETEANL